MNILNKITRKSLTKNRTRTIVTIIGIILSMALFTAVFEGAYSGVQYLIRGEVEQIGAYHGYYYDATKEEVEEIVKRDDIKDYATWQLVGWTNMKTDVDFNPYVTIVSVSDNFSDLVTTQMLEGRMPQNENEIIIPSALRSITSKSYDIGDKITLEVGKRMVGDTEIGLHDMADSSKPEVIADTQQRTYKIVGAYRSFDPNVTAEAGYIGITKGSAEGKYNVFFTLKHINQIYKDFANNQPMNTPFEVHGELMLYHGLSQNDNLMTVLYGFVVILACLIAFGSISLIYNSFAISVNERTKQYGILKSVGATKKQIMYSVVYEALVLSGIGIPIGLIVGCGGIGITFKCLQDEFSKLINYNADVKIGLVLNLGALIAAAIVCLITVLVSAWIPAKRCAKINVIETIRQVDDVKIKRKEVKTLKLTEKIFGFEGMMAAKNFKRNKKRYRSTVLSLFLSIVLFISTTSFCSYLTNAMMGVSSSQALTDVRYYTATEHVNDNDPDEVFALLSSANGVTDGLYMNYSATEFYAKYSNLDSTYLNKPFQETELQRIDENEEPPVFGYLAFVDDNKFRDLCKENNINAEEYFDKQTPKGIMYNKQVQKYQETDGEPWKWYEHKILDESILPCTLHHRTYREYDGYEFYKYITESDGSTSLVYYPADYLQEYLCMQDGSIELDESRAMILPDDEAAISTEIVVEKVIDHTLFAFQSDTPAIIYPYSMENTVLDEDYRKSFSCETYYEFTCENHQQTFNEMEKILQDNGMNIYNLYDEASDREAQKNIITVTKVFAYGFIILISLIAIANVFNTISTNIMLRRREFAMLKSVGLSQRGFKRMMNYECIIYGLNSLLYGLPVAVLVTYAIYKVTGTAYEMAFYIPWPSVAIAIGSVFIVVFATMFYATRKIKKDNPIEALKNENN